jgi:Kelch motif
MLRTLTICIALAMFSRASVAQPVEQLVNQLPDGISFTLILTDGSVMAQDNTYPNLWWKLTPDINGSYTNGIWTQLASLPIEYSPYAAASAVLADGRVIIMGGEYTGPNYDFTLTNQGAIYDPKADAWTPIAPPPGVTYVGDSPSVVLPDGRFLIGDKFTKRVSAFDPRTMRWTRVESEGKLDINTEEGWTLLPDGTVLTLDVTNAPRAEIYLPAEREWTRVQDTPVDLHSPTPVVGCLPYGPGDSLCYYPPGEIGPAILRPNGTVFATGSYANNDPNFNPGSAGHTAIYDSHSRTWTQGPDFPNNDSAGDSFGVLMPNGNVLVLGYWDVYEFDGTNFSDLTALDPYYLGCLTILPTGQVLGGGYGFDGVVYNPALAYTPTGTPNRAWEPVISNIQSTNLRPGSTYRIWGRQFNGLSQGAAFGDEFNAALNYPLVRITNDRTHHVFYARTHDHSSMGVATGEKLVWTNFDVPKKIESGPSQLVVVAIGIPSEPVAVYINRQDP